MTYFRKHNIKSITIRGNKLVIKYQDSEEEKEPNSTELKLIQSYCQEQGLTSLSLSDLQKTNSNTEKPTNYLPWIIGGGIILVIIIGAIIYFTLRKKEPKKDYGSWK